MLNVKKHWLALTGQPKNLASLKNSGMGWPLFWWHKFSEFSNHLQHQQRRAIRKCRLSANGK